MVAATTTCVYSRSAALTSAVRAERRSAAWARLPRRPASPITTGGSRKLCRSLPGRRCETPSPRDQRRLGKSARGVRRDAMMAICPGKRPRYQAASRTAMVRDRRNRQPS